MQGWGTLPQCGSAPLTGSAPGGQCCGNHLYCQSASESTSASLQSQSGQGMQLPIRGGQNAADATLHLNGAPNDAAAKQAGDLS
eukprot:7370127-Prymnesium_polylepis.1